MLAVAVFPAQREVRVVDHPEPQITSATEARMRVLDVGVCGTDREIISFQYGTPPEGSEYLIIGHESLSEVVEAGSQVSKVKPGDLVVMTVRRPCPHPSCVACRQGRQDFCYTGEFTERGIKQAHGYMTEFVVEEERYLHLVPRELRDVAVLVEPLTIAEKSLEQLWTVQRRLPWDHRRSAVVLGAGPVGILGAMALKVEGFDVSVYSRSPNHEQQNGILSAIGAQYIAAETHSTEEMAKIVGPMDVVYEGRIYTCLIQPAGVGLGVSSGSNSARMLPARLATIDRGR
jgi:threonine dehydrogenase-like Zn-dependent dehydrogenase